MDCIKIDGYDCKEYNEQRKARNIRGDGRFI